MIELNKMSAMEAKLDALMHRLDKRMHSANEIGAVEREGRVNNAEGRAEEGSYAVEEANYLNEQRAYHFKPNPNLPTHYTPAGTMRISVMVEEHNTSQEMGKIFSRGMLHQGSSSSNRERAEMNIRVKKGLGPLKTRCCSLWGKIKSC